LKRVEATASKSHRFLAKVPAPGHRVPSVPAFRKMRVQAATRTFTDVGGCRGAEGKPSRSQPAGVSRDLLAALSDERHGDPRKVTGSSQRSPLHAAGSGRCLHLGKCALMRGTEASNPACSSGESGANSLLGKSHRCPWGISPTSARPNRGAKRYLSAALFPSHTVIFNNGG
jgi:hypothetical protein